MFRAVKKGGENNAVTLRKYLKISTQSLLFRIIHIRSRCYYCDAKRSYPALLHLSKNADIRHKEVNLLHNIYNVLIVIKALLSIVMLNS